MKSSPTLAAVILLLCTVAAGFANAGFLDDLGRVADTVKKGAAMLPGTPASNIGSTATPSGNLPSNANLLLPLDLTAFPRAQLYRASTIRLTVCTTFLRVLWKPYRQAFDDRLAIQYEFVGLPTFLTFKNGKVVRRVDGNHTAVELSSKLLANLN